MYNILASFHITFHISVKLIIEYSALKDNGLEIKHLPFHLYSTLTAPCISICCFMPSLIMFRASKSLFIISIICAIPFCSIFKNCFISSWASVSIRYFKLCLFWDVFIILILVRSSFTFPYENRKYVKITQIIKEKIHAVNQRVLGLTIPVLMYAYIYTQCIEILHSII